MPSISTRAPPPSWTLLPAAWTSPNPSSDTASTVMPASTSGPLDLEKRTPTPPTTTPGRRLDAGGGQADGLEGDARGLRRGDPRGVGDQADLHVTARVEHPLLPGHGEGQAEQPVGRRTARGDPDLQRAADGERGGHGVGEVADQDGQAAQQRVRAQQVAGQRRVEPQRGRGDQDAVEQVLRARRAEGRPAQRRLDLADAEHHPAGQVEQGRDDGQGDVDGFVGLDRGQQGAGGRQQVDVQARRWSPRTGPAGVGRHRHRDRGRRPDRAATPRGEPGERAPASRWCRPGWRPVRRSRRRTARRRRRRRCRR